MYSDFNLQEKGVISPHTWLNHEPVIGRKRNPDGSYAPENQAAIFETQTPTGDDFIHELFGEEAPFLL